MNMRTRKALGCGLLLTYIAIYAGFAAALGEWLAPRIGAWGAVAYYAVAGVLWIFPLKPLMRWMNRGSGSDPS